LSIPVIPLYLLEELLRWTNIMIEELPR
jgi:hypothetical protein